MWPLALALRAPSQHCLCFFYRSEPPPPPPPLARCRRTADTHLQCNFSPSLPASFGTGLELGASSPAVSLQEPRYVARRRHSGGKEMRKKYGRRGVGGAGWCRRCHLILQNKPLTAFQLIKMADSPFIAMSQY